MDISLEKTILNNYELKQMFFFIGLISKSKHMLKNG